MNSFCFDYLIRQKIGGAPLVNSVRNEGPQLLGDGKIEQQMLFKF